MHNIRMLLSQKKIKIKINFEKSNSNHKLKFNWMKNKIKFVLWFWGNCFGRWVNQLSIIKLTIIQNDVMIEKLTMILKAFQKVETKGGADVNLTSFTNSAKQ